MHALSSAAIGVGKGRVRPCFVHFLAVIFRLIHRCQFIGVDRQFQVAHHRCDGFAQAVEHFLEHAEGFALVFVQRIFLPIGAQTDALAQMVECQQMFFPGLIEQLQ